jgi:hypothetical protein
MFLKSMYPISDIRIFFRFTLYLTSLENNFLPRNWHFLIRTHMQDNTFSIIMCIVLKKKLLCDMKSHCLNVAAPIELFYDN